MRSALNFNRITVRLAALIACVIPLTSCWIQHEIAIQPDPKVDPRLEGVWQITHAQQEEGRGDRDDDDLGVQGYIIFSKVDETTYKCIAIDDMDKDSEGKLPDMLVTTKEHKKHHFLNTRLTDYELAKEAEEGKTSGVKYLLLDYEFTKAGELILRYLDAGDFGKADKLHPIKSSSEGDKPASPGGPVGFSARDLKGNEAQLLDFYSDPKVRALFTSFGKYQKLRPAKG